MESSCGGGEGGCGYPRSPPTQIYPTLGSPEWVAATARHRTGLSSQSLLLGGVVPGIVPGVGGDTPHSLLAAVTPAAPVFHKSYLNQHQFASLLLAPHTSKIPVTPLNLSKEPSIAQSPSPEPVRSQSPPLTIKMETEDPVDVEGDDGEQSGEKDLNTLRDSRH
ncbi:retinal homeobox protein Rx1-like [Tropilaelaps mercedesae]|uniref:Retinal homeobox protein Rx1-like n=1 Tax=Tropilaelaps mercedesae TaxID=418985 RepID=A0A1V9Y2F5_9ACAR|nr:retinal homeobox protein Rx1-like [Tropilaelaps mercedesae]